MRFYKKSNKKIFIKNKWILNIFSCFVCFLVNFQAEGKLNVVTSTMTLKSLTASIAGDSIHLLSITKGPQDPHFLPAKPSYMLKARDADLLILVGMDLEIGWLPNIVHGTRNPRIQKGQPGYLDVSQFIKALSVPKGKVNRFFGDIHSFGNPHFLLDPLRAVQVSKGISEKLSELDSENEKLYIKNQEQFEKTIEKKMKEWRRNIQKSKVKQVVTYHSSFEYFLDRFQLELIGLIEEKPGIPPSSKHVLNLIKQIRASQSSCVLVSSFYSDKWAKKIKKAVPVHIESVPIEVMALEKAKDYISLIDSLVQAIKNCGAYAIDKQEKQT